MKEYKYKYRRGDGTRLFLKMIIKSRVGFLVGFAILLAFSVALTVKEDELLVAGIGIGVSLSYYFSLYLSYCFSREAFSHAADDEQVIRICDDYMEFENKNAISKIYWQSIKQIWKYSDIWTLEIAGRPYPQVFPSIDMPADMLETIENKVSQNKGKVVKR